MYLEGFVLQKLLLAIEGEDGIDSSVTATLVGDEVVEFPEQLDSIGADGMGGELNTGIAKEIIMSCLLLLGGEDQNLGRIASLVR